MLKKFIIVDDSHGEQFGSFDSIEAAWAELRRLADTAWNVEPNLTPCSSWETCSREYEIVEFDASGPTWHEINRVPGVEVGSKGIIWAASARRNAGVRRQLMTPKKHFTLLLQASAVWLAFWLAGLPDYFQQYSTLFMGVVCTFLSVAFSLYAVFVLTRCREEVRSSRSFWLSVYYTIPFAIYDTLYCGWYLGLGAGFLISHWYLTVFYFSIWLTFVPIAWVLNAAPKRA